MNLIERAFEGRSVRVAMIDGEPWFVAKDVALALGYAWHPHLIDRIPADWKSRNPIPQCSHGSTSEHLPDVEMDVISEEGLYLFLSRSDKPKAVPFQRYIAGEVMPSIRKTGAYAVTGALPRIDVRDPTQLAPLALQLVELVQEQQRQLAEAKPKVEAHDTFLTAEGSFCIRDVAKQLGFTQKRFIYLLLADKYLYRAPDGDLLPYTEHVARGLFVLRAGSHQAGDVQRTHRQTRITPKGLAWLQREFASPGVQLLLLKD